MSDRINRPATIGGFVIRWAVMGFVIAISVVPLLWVINSSFQSNAEILTSALNLPSRLSFRGYSLAFRRAGLHQKFLTSTIVVASSTVAAVTIYGLAAYALARFKFRLRNVLFLLLVSAILVPAHTRIQPVFHLIRSLGLYDTRTALIVVYTGLAMPICIFILRSFMLHLPSELEESAYLEGASVPRTFFRIMLPLSQPAVVTAGVLTFLTYWNELLYALMLTSSERNRTLPLAIRYFIQQFTFDFSAMFAALVIYVVPVIVIYIILQERIMAGLIAGAIKE